MKTNTKAINDDLSKYYPYFLLFGLYIVLYLPCLTTYTLSADDEIAFWRTTPEVWLAQGRIVGFFLEKYIIKQSVIIFYNEFFFGICATLSYAFILRAFRHYQIGVFDVLAFGIFCAFPVWYFLLEFYSNIPAVSIGILSCGLGIFFLSDFIETYRKRYFIYTVLCFFVSISSYQAYFYCLAVIIFSMILVKFNNFTRKSLKSLLICILALFVSTLIYGLMFKILLIIYNVNVGYIGSFLDIKLFTNDPLGRLSIVSHDIYKFAIKNKQIFIFYFFGVTIIVLLYFINITLKRKVFNVIISIAIITIPFIQHLFSSIFLTRLGLAMPFVVWFFSFYLYHHSKSLVKFVVVLATCLTLIQSVYFVSYYTTNQKLAYQYDVALAGKIYDRLIEKGGDLHTPMVVDVYGSIAFKTNLERAPWMSSGGSFFDIPYGSIERIVAFMKLIGYNNIVPSAEDSDKARYFEEYLKMPSWPAKDSVRKVDNVFLIKLSNQPNSKYLNMSNVIGTLDKSVFHYDNRESISENHQMFELKEVSLGHFVATGNDAQIFINLDRERIKGCTTFQVKADLDLEKASVFQVYFLKADDQQFNEKSTYIQPLLHPGHQDVTVILDSQNGFKTSIRLDPVNNIQNFKINKLDIKCVR